MVEKLVPGLLTTNKMSMSFGQHLEMSYSLFLLYVQVEVYQNMLKLRCLTLALL